MDIVNQNFVKVSIKNVVIPSLLDTGAARTLVSEELASFLELPIRKLQPNEYKLLFTADGTRMHLREITILPLKINDLTFHKEAYVVRNLSHRVILGIDFLEQANAVVDCRRRIVTFNNENMEIALQRVRRDYDDDVVMYARASQTMTHTRPSTDRGISSGFYASPFQWLCCTIRDCAIAPILPICMRTGNSPM